MIVCNKSIEKNELAKIRIDGTHGEIYVVNDTGSKIEADTPFKARLRIGRLKDKLGLVFSRIDNGTDSIYLKIFGIEDNVIMVSACQRQYLTAGIIQGYGPSYMWKRPVFQMPENGNTPKMYKPMAGILLCGFPTVITERVLCDKEHTRERPDDDEVSELVHTSIGLKNGKFVSDKIDFAQLIVQPGILSDVTTKRMMSDQNKDMKNFNIDSEIISRINIAVMNGINPLFNDEMFGPQVQMSPASCYPDIPIFPFNNRYLNIPPVCDEDDEE